MRTNDNLQIIFRHGGRTPTIGEAPAFACTYDSRIRVSSLSTNIAQPCHFHIAVKTALIFPIGLQRFTQCVRQHLALFYLSIREPCSTALSSTFERFVIARFTRRFQSSSLQRLPLQLLSALAKRMLGVGVQSGFVDHAQD